ncbi:hypothetical protein SE17_28610, partial [Kouleothrix aurantiaca]
MRYHDMTIEAASATLERTPDKRRVGGFSVRVLASPAGEMRPEDAATVSYDDKALQLSLQQLETRALDRAGLVALGRTLAGLLLPPKAAGALAGAGDLLAASLLAIGPDDGLRLRLRLPPQLAVLPWNRDHTGMRAQFDRWEDPVFEPVRTIALPMRQPLAAGFDVSYLVAHDFVDPLGRSVDPARIAAFHFTSSYGTNYETTDLAPRWLRGIHVVRGQQGLAASSVAYAVESVLIDGANVVNESQQRFATGPGERWRIQLQLYSARFVARDALFGTPAGTALSLTFPDGQVETRTLGADATETFEGLARGQYSVKLDAPGMAGITPAAISHDQEVRLLVLSYLDMS